MHKKPGEISSNTLSLRFMQNAAKARQEREVEAAQAKVKTEEEWELAPEVRDSWGVDVDDQSVSYEQSYIPFLFSNEGTGQGKGTKASKTIFKRRRNFGKNGEEEVEEKAHSVPLRPSPPPHDDSLYIPRGARSISSHGRSAASSSKPSHRLSHRPPVPPRNETVDIPTTVPTRGFMKPQVDSPRVRDDKGVRKKRRSFDAGDGDTSNGDDSKDGPRKRKKKGERES